MRDPRRRGTVLEAVGASLTGSARENRLMAVAECLSDVLDADFALVAELPREEGPRVLASASRDGRPLLRQAALARTALALALERGAEEFPPGLGRLFLSDPALRELGVESFLGRVLRDLAGSPVGLIAVLDRELKAWDAEAKALLSILAVTAEAEVCRRRALEKISRVAREWTATVDTMPDFVAVIDSDYRLQRVNLALARFASAHPKQLLGRTCHEVFHGRARPWPGCPHEQALRTGKSVTLRVNDPHVGVPMLVTCTPFLGAGGALAGTVHVARALCDQELDASAREDLTAEFRTLVARAQVLSRTLAMCAVCKKIRDEGGSWEAVDVYLRDRTGATFTHTFCPECARQLYPECFPE